MLFFRSLFFLCIQYNIFGTQRAEIFKRLSDESESISANIMVALSPFYVSVLRLMLRLLFLRYFDIFIFFKFHTSRCVADSIN